MADMFYAMSLQILDYDLDIVAMKKCLIHGKQALANSDMMVVAIAPVICVMAPPIHLGAWSMLWLLSAYYPGVWL